MGERISIIITSYNYEQYLAEAIESALAQDWPDVEVIVIDDGSRDGSPALAARYPVTVLSQMNQGLPAARNNALAFATGQYFLSLDADDILPPDALSRLHARLATAGPDTGYAYGRMAYFGYRDGEFLSRDFDPAALVRENYICATTLVRRDLFDRIGGYDRGMRERWEDWDLYLHFLHEGIRGVFLPEPILRCRKHKPSSHQTINTRKNLARTKLMWKYPGFFWVRWLRNPIKYGYYLLRYRVAKHTGLYGPNRAMMPVIVKDARQVAAG